MDIIIVGVGMRGLSINMDGIAYCAKVLYSMPLNTGLIAQYTIGMDKPHMHMIDAYMTR